MSIKIIVTLVRKCDRFAKRTHLVRQTFAT